MNTVMQRIAKWTIFLINIAGLLGTSYVALRTLPSLKYYAGNGDAMNIGLLMLGICLTLAILPIIHAMLASLSFKQAYSVKLLIATLILVLAEIFLPIYWFFD